MQEVISEKARDYYKDYYSVEKILLDYEEC